MMSPASSLDPAVPPPACRITFDQPCLPETSLRQTSSDGAASPPDRHFEPDASLLGSVSCFAALQGLPQAPVADPCDPLEAASLHIVESADRGRTAACGAARFIATHHGLTAALRVRFGTLAAGVGRACELALQDAADEGLSDEERQALFAIAEEAVGQATREGTPDVRVLLRRSRLGIVELSVAGEGAVTDQREVADSYRSLARIRQAALAVQARVSVRRLASGGLFVRCTTRWQEDGTGKWVSGR